MNGPNAHPRKPDAGNLLAAVGLCLFFLMLFVPTSYKEIKAFLLAGLFFGIVLGLLYGVRFRIHIQVFVLSLFYAFLGMAYVFYGYVRGNPGAVRVSTVYVIWPIVYMVILSAMSEERVFRGVARVLVWSSIAIPLYAIYYLFHELGFVPDALYIELDLGQSAGFYEDLVRYNLYSISSLLFLFPFVTASLLAWTGAGDFPVGRKTLVLAFVLTTCVSLLSGRRALWLVMLLTPLLTSAVLYFVRERQGAIRKTIRPILYIACVVGVSMGLLQTVFDVGISGMLARLSEGFQFSDDLGAVLRREQYYALLAGWSESPFFGTGMGAVAEGSVRSLEMPWSYELYFLSLLFHTGIVGIAAYAVGIGWIVFHGMRIVRRDPGLRMHMVPVLVAMACFLIASNTNPYLGKFDYLWVVFLPVAIINHSLLKRDFPGIPGKTAPDVR
ncbi:MAG: hypothetical protein AB1346_02190 [Thermodesulfobacteriota bacterium]